ncbi:MAG: hypothetical protein BWX80_02574 [Candidatus Hydrogenedentes bacterium ADurb.Bin101]|nr:MAG: hypothetical protein BWX80_02574 [Candidatus Hydrogenedentes bacterium ADurb.Bin101]
MMFRYAGCLSGCFQRFQAILHVVPIGSHNVLLPVVQACGNFLAQMVQ